MNCGRGCTATPPYEDPSCSASGSSHAKRRPCRDPCPTAGLGPWLPPGLHQRRSQRVFLCADSPFRTVACRTSSREDSASVAGGGWSDLRSGEKMLPTTQARARQARYAPGDRGYSQGLLAGIRLLWTAEHRFHRAGEFDHPPWDSGAGSSHLGDGTAVSAPARSSGVVARLLPLCASSPLAAGEARARARARRQIIGATLPAANSSDGCWENPSTMDSI